ncbi:MAG: hypothetical protein DRP83_01610 [Planctomycetota bacterium]|nr:MAG: hypothetical protein DRP83_01610 [Planctomycetota bacterium]
MLTKSDFEKAAGKIADQFVAPNCEQSINDLSKKIAADNNLNPDQIRTMVRLANLNVFGKMFQAKTGSDRGVKFEVGDPEVVIDALYDDARSLKVGAEKVAYDRTSDYYKDLYVIEQVKEAEATPTLEPEKPRYSKPELAMQLKRASDRFRMEGKQAAQRWQLNMETAVSMYKKTHGLKVAEAFEGFEKNLLSANADVAPEVQALRSMVLGDKVASYAGGAIEEIQNRHVAHLDPNTKEIFDYVKVATAARRSYEECLSCQEKIAESLGVM